MRKKNSYTQNTKVNLKGTSNFLMQSNPHNFMRNQNCIISVT